MARADIDMGTYDDVSLNFSISSDKIAAGTLTVPGTLSIRNDNPNPVIEFEGQINSVLNIMPSNFNFKKINPGDTKTIHLLVNVPESTDPGKYEVKIDFDFKIDTPPTTSRSLIIEVIKAIE